jgi:hypothetical protein
MKTLALLSTLLSIGCTSVTKSIVTEIHWTDGKRTFSYTSPKDTTVSRVHFDTVTGVFILSNLSTQVDQGIVQAAATARANDSLVLLEALKLAAEAARKAP